MKRQQDNPNLVFKEIESELAKLLLFAGKVAWAARMHSLYVPCNLDEFRLQELLVEKRPFGVDLLHLTNAVCHLADVGHAIAHGDRLGVSKACGAALAAYANDASEDRNQQFSAAQTFAIWGDTVHLNEARDALKSIQAKNWLRNLRVKRNSED